MEMVVSCLKCGTDLAPAVKGAAIKVARAGTVLCPNCQEIANVTANSSVMTYLQAVQAEIAKRRAANIETAKRVGSLTWRVAVSVGKVFLLFTAFLMYLGSGRWWKR